MSDETVAVVRTAIKAFSENDFERFFGISSTDIELYPPADEPGVKDCYVGWEEMLEYLANWYSGWQDYDFEPLRLVDSGEWVIVEAKEIGIAERSGARVEENFAHASRVRDGKIVEWRMYRTAEDAMDALGVDSQAAWSPF